MTSRDFCYWLQGFLELSNEAECTLTAAQVKCIKAHLNMVFAHEIDPSFGPKTTQDKLDQIHHDSMDPKLIRC